MNTPGVKHWPPEPDDQGPLDPTEASFLRFVVGKMTFVANDRLVIKYSVKELGRELAISTQLSMRKAKRMVRYLKGTKGYEVKKMEGHLHDGTIKCLVDSDFAGCGATLKSISGGVIVVGGTPMISCAKTQPVLAFRSGEADFYATHHGFQECLFIETLMLEFGLTPKIVMYSDSVAGRASDSRQGLGQLKHMNVKMLWCQQLLSDNRFQLRKISSKDNPADLYTKNLTGTDHTTQRALHGIVDTSKQTS